MAAAITNATTTHNPQVPPDEIKIEFDIGKMIGDAVDAFVLSHPGCVPSDHHYWLQESVCPSVERCGRWTVEIGSKGTNDLTCELALAAYNTLPGIVQIKLPSHLATSDAVRDQLFRYNYVHHPTDRSIWIRHAFIPHKITSKDYWCTRGGQIGGDHLIDNKIEITVATINGLTYVTGDTFNDLYNKDKYFELTLPIHWFTKMATVYEDKQDSARRCKLIDRLHAAGFTSRIHDHMWARRPESTFQILPRMLNVDDTFEKLVDKLQRCGFFQLDKSNPNVYTRSAIRYQAPTLTIVTPAPDVHLIVIATDTHATSV